MREHLQASLQLTGGLRFLECVIKSASVGVVNALSALGREDAQTDRQVRFTDVGWFEKDHILAASDEAERVHAFDLLSSEPRLKGEIEVAELFDDEQTA